MRLSVPVIPVVATLIIGVLLYVYHTRALSAREMAVNAQWEAKLTAQREKQREIEAQERDFHSSMSLDDLADNASRVFGYTSNTCAKCRQLCPHQDTPLGHNTLEYDASPFGGFSSEGEEWLPEEEPEVLIPIEPEVGLCTGMNSIEEERQCHRALYDLSPSLDVTPLLQ